MFYNWYLFVPIKNYTYVPQDYNFPKQDAMFVSRLGIKVAYKLAASTSKTCVYVRVYCMLKDNST